MNTVPMTRRTFSTLALGSALAVWAFPSRAYRPGSGVDIAQYDRPGDGSVNSYLLVGADSVAILDCQRTGVEARQVVAAAKGLGLPVEAIFLSHEHPDHITGLAVMAAAFPEASIIASAVTRDFIVEQGAATMAMMKDLFGAIIPDRVPVPHRIVADGDTLTLGGADWQVLQFGPGEAKGMTTLLSADGDTFFAADLFGNRATPYLLEATTGAWLAQLETAKERVPSASNALPGHGAAAPAGILLQEQQDYLVYFRRLVQEQLASGEWHEAAKEQIRRAVAERYPGYPKVAPIPDLVGLNADAVARELQG